MGAHRRQPLRHCPASMNASKRSQSKSFALRWPFFRRRNSRRCINIHVSCVQNVVWGVVCTFMPTTNTHRAAKGYTTDWIKQTILRMFSLWKFAQTSDEISILCIQFDDFEKRYLPLPTSPQPQMSNAQWAMGNMTNPATKLVREKMRRSMRRMGCFIKIGIYWIFVCHLAIDPICKT